MNVAEALLAASLGMWRAALNDTRHGDWVRAWMANPRPGDLVAIHHARGPADERIGRLLSVGLEPYPDWEPGEEPPSRTVWTIELVDGTEFRWENCQPLRIPTDEQHLSRQHLI